MEKTEEFNSFRICIPEINKNPLITGSWVANILMNRLIPILKEFRYIILTETIKTGKQEIARKILYPTLGRILGIIRVFLNVSENPSVEIVIQKNIVIGFLEIPVFNKSIKISNEIIELFVKNNYPPTLVTGEKWQKNKTKIIKAIRGEIGKAFKALNKEMDKLKNELYKLCFSPDKI